MNISVFIWFLKAKSIIIFFSNLNRVLSNGGVVIFKQISRVRTPPHSNKDRTQDFCTKKGFLVGSKDSSIIWGWLLHLGSSDSWYNFHVTATKKKIRKSVWKLYTCNVWVPRPACFETRLIVTTGNLPVSVPCHQIIELSSQSWCGDKDCQRQHWPPHSLLCCNKPDTDIPAPANHGDLYEWSS